MRAEKFLHERVIRVLPLVVVMLAGGGGASQAASATDHVPTDVKLTIVEIGRASCRERV